MRLGCVVSVLVVPLLLLAAPGRANSHAGTGQGRGPGAARGGDRRGVLARHHGRSTPSSTATSWAVALVEVADYIPPPPPTTTTTTTATAVPPQAAVRTVVTTVTPTTLAPTTTTTAPPPPPAYQETGPASWYQAPAGTCASPNIAFGTVVTVTDVSTGKSVRCTVDDRQDPSSGRVLDLAEATFAELADPSVGVIEVRVSW